MILKNRLGMKCQFRISYLKPTGKKKLRCPETYLGKASKQYVFLVSGKATLMPEVRGEWRTTAAHSNRDAKSTVGTVPMLWPYRMIFSGLMPYLTHHTHILAQNIRIGISFILQINKMQRV